MKNYRKLTNFVNPEVKVGDIVFVWADTAIVPVKGYHENILIVESYPELTAIDAPIGELPALVLETGIANIIGICALDVHILLDTKIQIGTGEFYVSSAFLLTEKEAPEHTKVGDIFDDELNPELESQLDAFADQVARDIMSGNPSALMFMVALEDLYDKAKK